MHLMHLKVDAHLKVASLFIERQFVELHKTREIEGNSFRVENVTIPRNSCVTNDYKIYYIIFESVQILGGSRAAVPIGNLSRRTWRFSVMSIRPSILPSVRPSVCPSARPSIHPSVHLSIHPSVHTSVYLLACPSIFQSI